jgi:hypothetical protein
VVRQPGVVVEYNAVALDHNDFSLDLIRNALDHNAVALDRIPVSLDSNGNALDAFLVALDRIRVALDRNGKALDANGVLSRRKVGCDRSSSELGMPPWRSH